MLKLKYFAYGSNMSTPRLRGRAPSAVFNAVARLPGHRLAFHKAGKDGTAKCDAFETGAAADFVPGVVFEIDGEDKAALDAAEGLGNGYGEKEVTVYAEPDGRAVKAFTYYATHIDGGLKPHGWYKDHVLNGAREHGLPEAHIRRIEAVATL